MSLVEGSEVTFGARVLCRAGLDMLWLGSLHFSHVE